MILVGEVREKLRELPEESVHCVVTSPPYWGLRDYGVDGQIGLEPTPDDHVEVLVDVLREVRRVLRNDGTLWLNYGDAYAGSWGSHGRQGSSGEMADRAVVESRIARRQIDVARPPTPGSVGVRTPGLKSKDLIGLPWMLAFALRAVGWFLRQDIVWHKPNPMPESVRDRCTKAHEYMFLLSKSGRYHYDAAAVAEPASAPEANTASDHARAFSRRRADAPGRDQTDATPCSAGRSTRNRRSVWTIPTQPFPGAHFATFPPELIRPCIRAGCPVGGTVLDPFFGAGTTGLVAEQEGCDWIGIELNPEYAELARKRLGDRQESIRWAPAQ